MPSFQASVIQSNVKMVDNTGSKAEIKRTIRENLNRVLELIDWVAAYRRGTAEASGNPILIGLPESFLHAFPRSEGAQLENMLKVAIEIPGEETELLAEKARQHNAYIFGASYATEPDWPDRYFNTGFIIDPQGEVALKYRKINCGLIEAGTSPHDVYDEYVERYGWKSLFPVLDTPIGKLSVLICADGLFSTEIARAMMMQGAEILCYPISTTSPEHQYYHIAAQAHSHFNCCYLVSPNLGQTIAKERALNTGGESVIVDFQGRILSMARSTDESTVTEMLHLEALRNYRLTAVTGPAMIRSECFAPVYQESFLPANFFADAPEQSIADEARHKQASPDSLFERGVLVRAGATVSR